MKIRLTQNYVNTLKPAEKAYWIADAGNVNLRLYIGTSGSKVWYVTYRKTGNPKKQSHKLGSADGVITVAEARTMTNDFMARLVRGEDPTKKIVEQLKLGEFLKNHYEPWVLINRKSGKETMNMLKTAFGFLYGGIIEELNILEIDRWRTKRFKTGSKASTINRLMAALLSALNWAQDHDLIEVNPLQRLKPLKEHDSDIMVRYLTEDERRRLYEALDAREKRMQGERDNHNLWLKERGKQALPALVGEYADYLKPMVLISLHTGIRQNNLFSLTWGDVDFKTRTMTLLASTSKPGKTLRLGINSVALKVLRKWREQSMNTQEDALVFPSPKTGRKMDNCAHAWQKLMKDAEIRNFRWHDMRHDFASQLVMKCVDLNTVRELMGHASLAMTLRYAHLAPENKLRAAEALANLV